MGDIENFLCGLDERIIYYGLLGNAVVSALFLTKSKNVPLLVGSLGISGVLLYGAYLRYYTKECA